MNLPSSIRLLLESPKWSGRAWRQPLHHLAVEVLAGTPIPGYTIAGFSSNWLRLYDWLGDGSPTMLFKMRNDLADWFQRAFGRDNVTVDDWEYKVIIGGDKVTFVLDQWSRPRIDFHSYQEGHDQLRFKVEESPRWHGRRGSGDNPLEFDALADYMRDNYPEDERIITTTDGTPYMTIGGSIAWELYQYDNDKPLQQLLLQVCSQLKTLMFSSTKVVYKARMKSGQERFISVVAFNGTRCFVELHDENPMED